MQVMLYYGRNSEDMELNGFGKLLVLFHTLSLLVFFLQYRVISVLVLVV